MSTYGRDKVTALAIEYGQRHRRELDAARDIAELAGVELLRARVELPFASGLTREERIGLRPDGLPTTFVPGRNALFLALAGGLAKSLTTHPAGVVIGCSAVDYSGYPDCRPEFLQVQQASLRLALDLPGFNVVAPLVDRTKAQTVQLAYELGPECWNALSYSWTCYVGGRKPCGECPACVLRAKGFAEAGYPDPALEVRE
jgi:7-cyano-7-deazaguanine synthase